MSERNVDLVRSVYKQWNEKGVDTIGPRLADGVELQDAPELPDAGTWSGRDTVLARLREVAEAVGGGWVDIQDVRPAGGEVVVSMVWHEQQATGSPAFGDVFHLVQVDGDRIARIRVFITLADALEAAAG